MVFCGYNPKKIWFFVVLYLNNLPLSIEITGTIGNRIVSF